MSNSRANADRVLPQDQPEFRMIENFEKAKDLFVEGVRDFEVGRFEDAEGKFQSSLALLPGRVSTLTNLAATLIKLSRPHEALIVLEQALAAEPDNLDAWCHRGFALGDLGRYEEAVACFDKVLESDQLRAAAWFYRGMALNELHRHDETLAAFDRFLAIQPDHGEAWLRRGQTLQNLDRHEEALTSYEQALAIDPGLALAWSNRGSILKDLGRVDEAATSFENAIAHGGDAELNGYFLAAVIGKETPPTAPKQSVQDLFDDYAESFDEHLVRVLHYQTPTVLTENLEGLGSRRFRHALDLGCGTGLCGPLVKPMVDQLDGVDLSPRMIEKARALAIYERLVQSDVAEYLQATDQRYDLVLAADVFVYIGDLEPVFSGVRRVMDQGGVFCFSAEIPEGSKDFELKTSLRYGHSERYVRDLASQHGFAIIKILYHPLRVDRERPVDGLYAYLSRV
jgi:predicted TPR repeat methyltransferase